MYNAIVIMRNYFSSSKG